jgi:hypothetical protein
LWSKERRPKDLHTSGGKKKQNGNERRKSNPKNINKKQNERFKKKESK